MSSRSTSTPASTIASARSSRACSAFAPSSASPPSSAADAGRERLMAGRDFPGHLPPWRTFQAPAGIQALTEEMAAGLVPVRDPRGHKGTFGTLVAICGSMDYLGAALL